MDLPMRLPQGQQGALRENACFSVEQRKIKMGNWSLFGSSKTPKYKKGARREPWPLPLWEAPLYAKNINFLVSLLHYTAGGPRFVFYLIALTGGWFTERMAMLSWSTKSTILLLIFCLKTDQCELKKVSGWCEKWSLEIKKSYALEGMWWQPNMYGENSCILRHEKWSTYQHLSWIEVKVQVVVSKSPTYFIALWKEIMNKLHLDVG